MKIVKDKESLLKLHQEALRERRLLYCQIERLERQVAKQTCYIKKLECEILELESEE